jgi:tetratricopeptide (TPR) repeat protein
MTAALLRELRARAPTVLVIEDVQWADEATLDVVTMLAARIATAPALVLASYRHDELERAPQLRLILGELVRQPGRLKVEPLSPAGVAELAAPHGVDADELYHRTGGNPFFAVEVLATESERIAETVRDAVLARAARLTPPARRLLEAVAVIPGQIEPWLLDVLAGDLVDRLDECLASGILAAGRTDVAFRRELARDAIEDATPPHRRLARHRDALAALAGRGPRDADLARLAHYAEAAADAEAVLRWAPRAAERAASSGAHREAEAQYARALRFADGLALPARADLLRRYADECYATARFDAAIASQREALDCHSRLGDRRGEGNALRSLSRLLFFAFRTPAEAERLMLEAVELLERLPAGHELAMAYANVSQRRTVVEDADAAVAWGERALTLGRRLDDSEAVVYALTNTGAAQFLRDQPAGQIQLERALELARRHDLEDYAGRAFLQLVIGAMRHRRLGLAERHLEAGLEYYSERGLDTWRLYLLAWRSRLKLDRGRWGEATEPAAEVQQDPRSAPVARGWALTVQGLVRARQGDAQASEPLEAAHALVEATEELVRIAPVAAARAEAAWLAGENANVPAVTDAALSLALDRRVAWVTGELAYWRW